MTADLMPSLDMPLGQVWRGATVTAVTACDMDPLDPNAHPCVRTTWSDGVSTYVWLTSEQAVRVRLVMHPSFNERDRAAARAAIKAAL